MRLFGGKGLLAAGSDVYYDFFDGWVPLVPQHRPRYAPTGHAQNTWCSTGESPRVCGIV